MLLQDIRFGLRTALKNKAVTAISVVCLGVGVGLNTMMFSVTDGVLIQSLPYRDPDALVVLRSTYRPNNETRGQISWLDYRDWQERARSFGAVGAVQYRNFTVSDGGDTDRYQGAAISYSLFSVLGKQPQLGRDFTADDDRVGAEPVVVISDDLWKRRYAADPAVIGRAIQVNSRPHTVIGVMPPRFRFPENQYLWLPLSEFAFRGNRAVRALDIFARIRDGVTHDQAQKEADIIAAALASAYPDSNRDRGAWLEPLRHWAIPDDVQVIVLTMMGAVTMVLLIACFNVANLMLARASSRSREMSIRSALGASRAQIVAQLLIESVIVGLFSVPVGIACAAGGLKLMDLSIPPDDIPYFIHWSLDLRSLLYALAVAAATGMVFGLAPAIQASKSDLQEAMKDSGRGVSGGGRPWLRNGLVVAEVALSLVLLIGASLFVRSFVNLRRASGGFDTRPLMTLRYYTPTANGVDLAQQQYATSLARTQRAADIVARIEALPGVQSAFASSLVPLWGGGDSTRIGLDGRVFPKDKEPVVGFVGVSPHMVKTLGLSLIRGRELTDAEATSDAHYAVVNQTMAARFWPNEDPIGRRFHVLDYNLDKADKPWFTIVGIVPDFRHGELVDRRPIAPAAYVPLIYGAYNNMGLTIRVAGDPANIAGPARDAIRASDPKVPVFEMMTMEQLRARSYWQYFLFGWMFSLFGGIALALAAIGVYGVLSYVVVQRTQEIGVRMALGADRGNVLRLVVAQGLKLAIGGVAIGVVGSFFVTPVIQSELFSVSAKDPASFVGVSIFLTAIAFVASYVPARRATAVDPLVALRAE